MHVQVEYYVVILVGRCRPKALVAYLPAQACWAGTLPTLTSVTKLDGQGGPSLGPHWPP